MPAGINPDTWAKNREQAELQLHARETGEDIYRLLPQQEEAGFALLPEPSPGDLFFDFEGNPFWDKDGSLEYLWGILDVDGNFTPLHAHDHDTERQAFEQFIDLVHARLDEYPDLHVYHYAAYEITALKRLMGRYGTREAELDDLLRRGVFVDLLKVVRNGLRTSRRGYGLKEMEAFLDFERQAEVKDGGTSIVIFEQWMQTGEQALLDQIDEYNREDCIATRLLRDWLLELKPLAGPIAPAPPPPEPRPVPEAKEERAELRAELLEAGEELAAQLLDYHDRERKPVWWAYFDRMEQTPEELLDDPEAISGLEQDGEPVRVDRSWAYTLVFPPQEHKLGVGQQTADRATGKSPGSITELDRESRRLVLKRGRSFEDVPLPEAIVPKTAFNTPEQEAALMRFGRSLLAGDRHYPALESILRREPFDRPVQTSDLDEMKELVLGLDDRHLVIQGPPGSGKTWTSGRLIAHLLANGKTVGVASTSHKAIHNLLDAVVEAAGELGISFDGRKKASAGNPESYYDAPGIEDVDHADECRRRRPRRRDSVALRAREPGGRLPLRRRGRAGVARRRARDGDGGAERRPRRRPAAARPGDPGHASRPAAAPRCCGTCSATTRPCRPTAASSSSARTGSTRTSAATSRRSSTRGGSSRRTWRGSGRRRSGPGCATSRSSTTRGGRSRRRRSRRCAAWSRSCGTRA